MCKENKLTFVATTLSLWGGIGKQFIDLIELCWKSSASKAYQPYVLHQKLQMCLSHAASILFDATFQSGKFGYIISRPINKSNLHFRHNVRAHNGSSKNRLPVSVAARNQSTLPLHGLQVNFPPNMIDLSSDISDIKERKIDHMVIGAGDSIAQSPPPSSPSLTSSFLNNESNMNEREENKDEPVERRIRTKRQRSRSLESPSLVHDLSLPAAARRREAANAFIGDVFYSRQSSSSGSSSSSNPTLSPTLNLFPSISASSSSSSSSFSSSSSSSLRNRIERADMVSDETWDAVHLCLFSNSDRNH
jgi:hypothetical protein